MKHLQLKQLIKEELLKEAYKGPEQREMEQLASTYVNFKNDLANYIDPRSLLPQEYKDILIQLHSKSLKDFKKLSSDYESKFGKSIGFYWSK
jgi:hypothetical protein